MVEHRRPGYRGPDGRLYALSDQSSSIARLGDLDPRNGSVEVEETWHLEDAKNSEGLVILDDGTPVVAVDRKARRGNLLAFEPLRLAT